MPRAILYLLLSIPLLTPPGFCLCHVGEAESHCAADGSIPADEHRDDDPNCPCHNADAFVRGFLPQNLLAIDCALAVTVVTLLRHVADQSPTDRPDRDNVPIFATPSRFVVYRSLLI
jgi:hypothetical protein